MTLLDQQEALERRGLDDGERRYLKRVTEAYGSNAALGAPPVRHLAEAALEWLTADLRLRLDDLATNGMGPFPAWAVWTIKVGEETTAYLTLKAALNGVSVKVGHRYRKVALNLFSMMLDEVRAETFLAASPSGFADAINHKVGAHAHSRSARMLKRMRVHKVDVPVNPGAREAMAVGSQLLAFMVEATGLFTVDNIPMPSRRHSMSSLRLVPTQGTLDWIATRSDRLRLTMPLHPPMVVPPKDWAQGMLGGYHFALAGTLPLVRHVSKEHQRKLDGEPMPLVYSALNALQRTPWRINTRVLDVVRNALDGRLPEILPPPADLEVPPRPVGVDVNSDEAREWRRTASDIYSTNERRRLRRADVERAVVVAEQVKDDDRFYFPYTLDFRGRAYPSVEFLNPHGPDVVRGLLEFGDGVDVSHVGAGWLAVHGANTLGAWDGVKLTKLNFQERVNAIKGLSEMCVRIADDPYSNREWTQAGEPWQFLAFCMEWAEWTTTGSLTTHLPVGLDGTANGLQHFSAMLRDATGAKSVGMTNTDRPSDIYADVAEAVLIRLGETLQEPLSALWLESGLVDRSLVKRPVMTLAYGATRYGFVDQLLSTLRQDDQVWEKALATFRPTRVKIRVAVQHLSSILWETLSSTVGGALSAMDWLQTAASSVSVSTGGPVSWTVPMTGFPAHMEYWKPKRTQVKTLVNGTIFQPSVYEASTKPQTAKIRNAISPNIVHSLDAAAMMATTVACAARGVPAFSMIHDSYAVHAEYVPTLADALRTSFVDLYRERNTLDGIKSQWLAIGVALPDVPALGDYNIDEVRDAQFFFS